MVKFLKLKIKKYNYVKCAKIIKCGRVAQGIEHMPSKPVVAGSIPAAIAIFYFLILFLIFEYANSFLLYN